MTEPGPLTGFRIVDFTANMSGPFATMVLGDQGADVVKVEAPEGDVMRRTGTGSEGYAAFYANLNRSKRSIVLDLSAPAARPVVDALLDGADVVVHNIRAGAAARLGLDAESVRAGRPSVVHVAISGFGTDGPYRDRPAYDHVIQALAGFAAAQADPRTGVPELVRQGIVDKLTAQTVAQAITAALLERARTGVGGAVQVSMLDAALAFLWPDGMMSHTIVDPEIVRPPVSRSFRLTRTTDGHLAFMVVAPRQYRQLVAALDLGGDESLAGLDNPSVNAAPLLRAVAARFGEKTTAEAMALLTEFDIPAAPVSSLDALHEHPQVVAAGSVDAFDHPVLGAVRQANPAVRFRGERTSTLRPAPRLGEHTAEICAELGFGDEDVERLAREGAFGPPAGAGVS